MSEDPVTNQGSLADQVRYYAKQIEILGEKDSTEPNWNLLGLSMAMRMTAQNIEETEKRWASKAPTTPEE